MIPGEKKLNVNLVKELLDTVSSERVLRTPLCEAVKADQRIWPMEQNGEYSVRSAYKFCLHSILETSHLCEKGDWQGLWKLDVPPKVKHFLWRACCEVIPTRSGLQHRGVAVPNRYPWCDGEGENVCHILLTYQKNVAVWSRLGIWSKIDPLLIIATGFGDNFFKMLSQLQANERQMWAMSLWSLWRSKNQKVWENIDETLATITYCGKTVWDEWAKARRPRHEQHRQFLVEQQCNWVKPPPGFLKCNIDASFLVTQNRVGVGMCLRDEFGLFVGAKTQWIQPVMEVKLGEAYGLKIAIDLIRELGFKDVIF